VNELMARKTRKDMQTTPELISQISKENTELMKELKYL